LKRYDRYMGAPRTASELLPVLDLAERCRGDAMFLSAEPGGRRVAIHPIEGARPNDGCWRLYVGAAPCLDLYERYRDDVRSFFLTGGFGGVTLFCWPVTGVLWRLHLAQRQQGVNKDIGRPTAIAMPAAPPRAALRGRPSITQPGALPRAPGAAPAGLRSRRRGRAMTTRQIPILSPSRPSGRAATPARRTLHLAVATRLHPVPRGTEHLPERHCESVKPKARRQAGSSVVK
jgi:hypothetical protein